MTISSMLGHYMFTNIKAARSPNLYYWKQFVYNVIWNLMGAHFCQICRIFVECSSNLCGIVIKYVEQLSKICRIFVGYVESLSNISVLCRIYQIFIELICRNFVEPVESLSNLCRILVKYVETTKSICRILVCRISGDVLSNNKQLFSKSSVHDIPCKFKQCIQMSATGLHLPTIFTFHFTGAVTTRPNKVCYWYALS